MHLLFPRVITVLSIIGRTYTLSGRLTMFSHIAWVEQQKVCENIVCLLLILCFAGCLFVFVFKDYFVKLRKSGLIYYKQKQK